MSTVSHHHHHHHHQVALAPADPAAGNALAKQALTLAQLKRMDEAGLDEGLSSFSFTHSRLYVQSP